MAPGNQVRLGLYNLFGGRVPTFVDEMQEPGYERFNCNASNLASGIYFYPLSAGDYSETTRMMLSK